MREIKQKPYNREYLLKSIPVALMTTRNQNHLIRTRGLIWLSYRDWLRDLGRFYWITFSFFFKVKHGLKVRLVGFYDLSTIVGYLILNPLSLSLYIYIYICVCVCVCVLKILDLVCFGVSSISTIVGYLIPNPLYTYTLNIYDLVWLDLWHINHCKLFNAKSSLYIHIKYIGFDWVEFYGISTIICHLMPNPLYTYISNIYDLVWLGFMAYQPL